jgi:hypothetical protein
VDIICIPEDIPQVSALVDSGATSSFIDQTFVVQHNIPVIKKSTPVPVEVIDGRTIASGAITHETTPLELCIGKHTEKIVLNIISTPHHPIILGLPWLEAHNPIIDWRSRTLTFSAQRCTSQEPHAQKNTLSSPAKNPVVKNPVVKNPVVKNPKRVGTNSSFLKSIMSSPAIKDPQLVRTKPCPIKNLVKNPAQKTNPVQIFVDRDVPFYRAAKNLQVFAIHVNPANNTKPPSEPTLVNLPKKYKDFVDVFEKINVDQLPAYSPYDCPIDLEEGHSPPFGPIYGLSEPKLQALRDYFTENLAKGFIQHSKSPAGALILFVKKKDDSLRLYVDYRGLNKITKKNRYPLPLISGLLDRLRTGKIFTKLDLRGAYNLLRIRPNDEWKTAFRTCYGHFEYTVMPFSLTNAPAVFQHLMNDIFQDYMDEFVVVYLDDILIFSKDQEIHDKHVRLVLATLREHGLYAKLEKCEFDKSSVVFLGYVISPDGIFMDKSKVKTIQCWATPSSVKDVQRFLGFANFYRRFIKRYSKIATPLITLTCKDKPFSWNLTAQAAFDTFKMAFTSAPILIHPDLAKPFIVETDASDFALGAILPQFGIDGLLHLIAFYSRKLTNAEINYQVYDKELLVIITAFEQWRPYLAGAQHRVQVLTDHKNLLYFTTTWTLNRRQARWSIFLADFDFEI